MKSTRPARASHRAVKRGVREVKGIDQHKSTGDLQGLQDGVESQVGSGEIPAPAPQSREEPEQSSSSKRPFAETSDAQRGALAGPQSHS